MRQKKGELLDLLRKDSGSAPMQSPSSRPIESAPASGAGQSASSSEQLVFPGARPVRRSVPWFGILAAAVPLLLVSFWAAGFFETPLSTSETTLEAAGNPALAISDNEANRGPQEISKETPPAQPKVLPVVEAPAVNIASAPKVTSRKGLFGIQVITYDYTERNIALAREAALALKKSGLPNVRALLLPADQPKQIVIFVGEAPDKLDLARIRGRLRVLEYPAGSGQRPFASALTAPLPTHIQ